MVRLAWEQQAPYYQWQRMGGGLFVAARLPIPTTSTSSNRERTASIPRSTPSLIPLGTPNQTLGSPLANNILEAGLGSATSLSHHHSASPCFAAHHARFATIHYNRSSPIPFLRLLLTSSAMAVKGNNMEDGGGTIRAGGDKYQKRRRQKP
ncbi:hypothetical protein CPLU01_09641 [Colletotrichum plurivorum]|uniref:Uncharacterized protein n=1 Tax=Colletotrichum plurivorum TaxID=2175906 RepID=A0A8H6NBG8_9PEZI|nr:hypothetical protein CPLU01_09641 [Colletotrichum plurivorum]